MPTPTLDPTGPEELARQALAVIHSDRLPYLATVEGDQPRLRPVSPVRIDGFTVYIANLRCHGKTAEIEANPRVELCYLDGHHDQVRITGTAEVVTDPAIKRRVWDANPQIRRHVSGPDSPDFILYRVVPARVRFMKDWALTYREVPLAQAGKEE